MDKFKFIDLFSGIGGFRIAFESVGGKCVFSSDIDKAARETYKMNFLDEPEGDITQIDEMSIPDHDVLCAGFPCQPFSLAGKRLGFEDTRGTLFFDIVRIVKVKRPKVIILENVAGLVNHDKGKTLKVIAEQINFLDYKFFWKVMNACDYGVPQNRSRWYGIAIRKDIIETNYNFVFPVARKLKVFVRDIIKNESSKEYAVTEIAKKNIDKFVDKFKSGMRYDSNHVLIANEIRPSKCNFRCDGISPCLTAKMGTGGNNIPVIVDNYRKFTEKECLKLMGYPDSYKIKINSMQSYKQIGNSVVVPVIKLLADEIIKVI